MPRNYRRHRRNLILLLLSFVMVVAFQNCSGPVRFQASLPALDKIDLSMGGGNGEGYGGKVTHYHFVPGFTCEGQESAFSEINKTASALQYIENMSLQCGASGWSLAANEVDRSPYQADVIGYRDMIFELLNAPPAMIPNELVEAWCFDDPVAKRLEVRHRYNSVNQNAQLRTMGFTPDGLAADQPPRPVSRVVEARSVLYRTDDYELLIDKDRPSPVSGQYLGSLKTTIAGRPYQLEVSCRLGGYLDARLWPAQLLFGGDVRQFELIPTQNKVIADVARAPLSLAGDQQAFLAGHDRTTGVEEALTPVKPQYFGSFGFTLKPDASGLLYRSDEGLARGAFVLLDFEFAKKISRPLTSALTSFNQSVDSDFRITSDGWIFYRDGHQEVDTSDVERWLWSRPLSASVSPIIYQVNQDLIMEAEHEVARFDVSEPTRSVVYAVVRLSGSREWWAANYDGSQRRQLNGTATSNYSWNVNTIGEPLLVGSRKEFLVFPTYLSPMSPRTDMTVRAVAIDGSSSQDLMIPGGRTRLSSPNGLSLYIEAEDPKTLMLMSNYLVQAGSWTKTQIPVLQRAQFSADSRQLYGMSGTSFTTIDTSTGQVTHPCGGGKKIIGFAEDKSGQFYLVEENSLDFVIHRANSITCTVVNRMPKVDKTALGTVLKIEFAPDNRSLLMTVRTGYWNEDYTVAESKLYWVPMDGRAIVRIDAPALTRGSSEKAQFTPDSKAILFWGNQLDSSRKSLMQWPIPSSEAQ